MKAKRTTRETRIRAEELSKFLWGRVIEICRWRIEEGEEDAQAWIDAIEKKYNVISY
jgi:hypothetical protein